MGLKLFSSGSDYTPTSNTTPNPNKFRFTIEEIIKGKAGVYDLLVVKYPDCTTYCGHKLIMVKTGTVNLTDIELDPHFLHDGKVVARFKPTDEGYKLAWGIIHGTEF